MKLLNNLSLVHSKTITSMMVFIIGLLYGNTMNAQPIPFYNYEQLITDRMQILHLNQDNVIEIREGRITPDSYVHNGDKYFHGMLVSSVQFNDDIYVADSNNQHIYRVKDEIELEWVVGGRGRGPGEFLDISHLSASDMYLIAQDRSQLIAWIFNSDMEIIHQIPIGSLSFLTAGRKYILVPAGIASDYFYDIRKALPPFSKVGQFLKHIIPVGMQPTGYKSIKAVSNKNGDYLITIQGLPYFFLFDENLNHKYTLKLKSDVIDNIILENPPLTPVTDLDMMQGRVSNIVGGIYLTENRDIMFSIRRTLYHLSYNDGSYQFEKSYQFFIPNQPYSENQMALGIFNIVFNYKLNELCMVSIHYSNRYCYTFDKYMYWHKE